MEKPQEDSDDVWEEIVIFMGKEIKVTGGDKKESPHKLSPHADSPRHSPGRTLLRRVDSSSPTRMSPRMSPARQFVITAAVERQFSPIRAPEVKVTPKIITINDSPRRVLLKRSTIPKESSPRTNDIIRAIFDMPCKELEKVSLRNFDALGLEFGKAAYTKLEDGEATCAQQILEARAKKSIQQKTRLQRSNTIG